MRTTHPENATVQMKITNPLTRVVGALATATTATAALSAAPARAHTCNNGGVKPGGGSSDWYQRQGGAWQYYPPPTFDPNSGDGIGPDQPMPPACIRFHQPCPQ